MPAAASAAGEAFELLASRYLCDFSGLAHLAAPFYARLPSGRWVQFDGVFSRSDGAELILEAKFYNAPIGLSTPGVSSRMVFAKETGASGIVLASRSGFTRDIMRLRLPIEKVLLSWHGMARGLRKWGRGVLSAALDPLFARPHGFTAASGAALVANASLDAGVADGAFIFVPVVLERWARRLPAAPTDIYLDRPPRQNEFARTLDVVAAWTVEDSLRGFAPSDPRLLESVLGVLFKGPLDLDGAWRALWRRGYRGRSGGLKNALENLCTIGAAEKFRASRGLFYAAPRVHASPRDASETLSRAVRRWPAYSYFRSVVTRENDAAALDKHVLAARLSQAFMRFYPYAHSLYNPAKVAGILALDRYLSSTSTTSESYASSTPSGSAAETSACMSL